MRAALCAGRDPLLGKAAQKARHPHQLAPVWRLLGSSTHSTVAVPG
jgi:hypothetical protein